MKPLWSAEHTKLLAVWYPTLDVKILASMLGRSVNAVYLHAGKLGMRKVKTEPLRRQAIQARWYQRHGKERNQLNREGDIQRARARRSAQREAIFALLGNTCVLCGFADTRALHIHHRNGGGYQERRAFYNPGRYYQHIVDVGGEGYQILCANCNFIERAKELVYAKN